MSEQKLMILHIVPLVWEFRYSFSQLFYFSSLRHSFDKLQVLYLIRQIQSVWIDLNSPCTLHSSLKVFAPCSKMVRYLEGGQVSISTFHPEDKCILFCERYANLKNGWFCLFKNCPNTSQSVVLFRNETEVLKVPKVVESISEYS